MVAASTTFGYSSVNQFDGNRSIMCRQLSSCSSCSGNSNCGRSNLHQHQQCHHHHQHHQHQQQQQNQQQQQQHQRLQLHHHHHHHHQQQQQKLRERNCTRCQNFHRHNHRQRRRSSALLQYQNCSPINTNARTLSTNTTTIKAMTSITATTAAATTTNTNMGSTLTIASMPSTLIYSMGCSDSRKSELRTMTGGSLSAAATPIATPQGKHCTFALTPIIIPPPNNKVSFLSKARLHPNVRAPSPTTTNAIAPALSPPATCSEPTLLEVDDEQISITACLHSPDEHATSAHTEHRQSLQSQITTIDDLDTEIDGLIIEEQQQP